MVVIENNMDDSYGDSSFAIANAYRGASDEDTRQVLNAMSHPAQVDRLTFYMLPSSWMNACLSFLMGQTSQRPILKIENASLLSSGQVSDEEAEEETFYESRGRNAQKSTQKSITLRRDLVHRSDFFCVGSNVWNLVSEKFGFDEELAYKVVSKGQGLLAVNFGIGTPEVPIPATGHFDYRSVAAQPTDVVSDEEDDDLFPGPSGLSSRRQEAQPQDDTVTSTAIILLPAPEQKSDDMELEPESAPRPSTLKRKRYGSGLGNLGNTCFMNSTLQCLANTEPLRRYFCSGAYQSDLNRENPLGTGGELATEFAELLCEMWGSRQTTNTTFNGVVYPRNFKFTLGKHAEQFLGYDQHDSQEFATYLLDALHEDTNRVTKKPYIEKPEQGEDEPDAVAAKKSWDLHLQREDSRVLENFMGQVKSRVQCPKAGCGRVSTTFDPFMYLSVPIPGATDRTLKVTFVPLSGPKFEMKITMPKTGTIMVMQKKIVEQWQKLSQETVLLGDLVAVDVWNGEVYSVYKGDDEVDKIRETDVTMVYQVAPASEVEVADEDLVDPNSLPECRNRPNKVKLQIEDMTEINAGDEWKATIDSYVSNATLLSALFNPKRATREGLMRFYNRLGTFLDECYTALQEADAAFGDGEDEEKTQDQWRHDALEVVCNVSKIFIDVVEVRDLARLEFTERKLRAYIIDQIEAGKSQYKHGLNIQIVFQREEINSMMMRTSSTNKCFTHPMYLRTAGSMTVYQLRELLADRLPFKDTGPPTNGGTNLKNNVDPVENDASTVVPLESEMNGNSVHQANGHHHQADLGRLVMRQIPMGYSHQKTGTYGYRSSYGSPEQLGMLERLDDSAYDGAPIHLADKEADEEKRMLSELVGHDGQIFLYWPKALCDRFLDLDKYEDAEHVTTEDALAAAKQDSKVVTVSKCIEKYCQMEQLEETEMWYCNKCQEHVRAWKQFHLYQTPPILIVHLKRFHYSSSTHRRDKIDAFIDFPLSGLDLSSEVMHFSQDEKPMYDCYAVSNHYGGLGGGHYTAYALNDDGVWCHYDDSRITTDVDQKDVISNAAYVLYYKRRDVVFETPEFSPPLPALVQDHPDRASPDMERSDNSNLVRVESMDLDETAVGPSSPPSSNTSTSAVPDMSVRDDDDYEYDDSYQLPS